MKNETIIVGLDIGTTKIACFIGKRAEDGKLRILGFGKSESNGVERGEVRNIIITADSIRKAVKEASDQANYEVHDVYVGIAGQNIKSKTSPGSVMIPSDQPYIMASDIDRIIEDQYHLMMSPGEEIIHVFPQSYYVDDNRIDVDPVGVSGKCLKGYFHIVTANRENIKNIKAAVEEAGLKVKGLALEPVASAHAVLDDNDRNAGVALVDIGGGTTDIAIFRNGNITHTSVLPIAGNCITNDIREGCKILKNQSEILKTKYGSCLPNIANADDVVVIPGLHGQPSKEISVKTLAGIIKSRMEIILEQVEYEITQSIGSVAPLLAGLVLTGGGSELKDIKGLAELTVRTYTRIGTPNDHLESNQPNIKDYSHPMYATGIGLVLFGLLKEEGSADNFDSIDEEPTTAEPTPHNTNTTNNPFDIFTEIPEAPSPKPIDEPTSQPEQPKEEVKEGREKRERKKRNSFGVGITKFFEKMLNESDE